MLHKDTQRIQELLGEFVRTGIGQEIPGLTPGRIDHYRRLVYNVVRDTMDTAFPISRAALGESGWDLLVHEFFSNEACQTPQVWKLPYEFYIYHSGNESGVKIGKPYLEDLLYFEWMEIEIHTMPDRPFPEYGDRGNIFRDPLAFNPEYEIIKLEYPVHLHSAQESAELRGNYFILVMRDPDTGNVSFMDLSPVHAYILTRLVEEHLPLNDLKSDVAWMAGIESMRYLDDSLSKFIGDLMEKRLILGFLKA